MRLAIVVLCMLFLTGCMESRPPVKEAVYQPHVFFSEDFANGLGNWTVISSGGGGMRVEDIRELAVDKALGVRSQMMKSAYAKAPGFQMDWSKDYAVSFDLLLQHRDNYGYILYQDPNIRITLGEASGIMCESQGKNQLVGRIDTNTWHRIAADVSPRFGEYEVYLDGERKVSCSTGKYDVGTFILGDTDPGDQVHGDGLWDNIRIADQLP